MTSERRADSFGVIALAAAGTMTAHELGYLTNAGADDRTHMYFGVLGPVVVLALCLAGWFAAVRIVRRDVGRAPSFALLAGLQIGGYVVMEVAEQVTSGGISGPISIPVFFGLALQPVVAWVALQILDAGHRVIRALFVDDVLMLRNRSVVFATVIASVVGTQVPSRLRVRGPPVR
jgi:preprotein translocase subunit SecY